MGWVVLNLFTYLLTPLINNIYIIKYFCKPNNSEHDVGGFKNRGGKELITMKLGREDGDGGRAI